MTADVRVAAVMVATGLFVLAAVGFVLACERRTGPLIRITKPLMMPLLAVAYLLASARPTYWIVAGLLLGAIGDTALIEPDRGNRFLIGLAAFLLGHIAYVAALLAPVLRDGLPEPWMFLAAAVLAVAGRVVYRLLRPGLGSMKRPVLLYTTVILAMVLAALLRAPLVSGPAFWLPLSGALFFVASDTALAYRAFRRPFPYAGQVVAVTYVLAQSLIVTGVALGEGLALL
ncbi:MAG: lysoplasmalogenase [Spirochaetia bacterium]